MLCHHCHPEGGAALWEAATVGVSAGFARRDCHTSGCPSADGLRSRSRCASAPTGAEAARNDSRGPRWHSLPQERCSWYQCVLTRLLCTTSIYAMELLAGQLQQAKGEI